MHVFWIRIDMHTKLYKIKVSYIYTNGVKHRDNIILPCYLKKKVYRKYGYIYQTVCGCCTLLGQVYSSMKHTV